MNVSTEMLSALTKATINRVPLLQKLPHDFNFFFIIESKNILDNWIADVNSIQEAICLSSKDSDLTELLLAKTIFYFQFFGEFFSHHSTGEDDATYAAGCEMYVNMYYEGNPKLDRAEIFFKAFPEARK